MANQSTNHHPNLEALLEEHVTQNTEGWLRENQVEWGGLFYVVADDEGSN